MVMRWWCADDEMVQALDEHLENFLDLLLYRWS